MYLTPDIIHTYLVSCNYPCIFFVKSRLTSVENTIEAYMIDKLENDSAMENPTVYGAIALSIFLICFGMSYLVPVKFPSGTLFIIAGILIILVNMVKQFKNIGYDRLEILFGIGFFVWGLNKVFILEISFFPIIIVVLSVIYLVKSINKLRSGQIFE